MAGIIVESVRGPDFADGGGRSKVDVYRPTSDGPVPVLLARTPYFRGLDSGMLAQLHPLRAVRRGYAVVVQDCRGRFGSEGVFEPFSDERSDGHAAVQWAADQPWSDGRVAMWGASYWGATQLLAAIGAPPELRTVSPAITAASYSEGWVFTEDGSLRQQFVHAWTSLLAVESARRGGAVVRPAELRSELDAAYQAHGREVAEWPADLVADLRRLVPFYLEWLEDGVGSDAWGAVDIDRHFAEIHTPALHIGGWYDLFLEGTIDCYQGLRDSAGSAAARAGQRLVVGPWAHGEWGRRVGDLDFGDSSGEPVFDHAGLLIAHFDEQLGRPDAAGHRWLPTADEPVSVFVMGENTWRRFPDWPPPSASPVSWRLKHDATANVGSLVRQEESAPAAGSRHVSHDPDHPARTEGGRILPFDTDRAGPLARRPAAASTAIFESEPLPSAVTVAGCVRATTVMSSTASSFDVCMTLVDVHPDGRCFNVVAGHRRVRSAPGTPTTVDVVLGSTAIRLGPHHRLRLEVSGSDFPAVEVWPRHAARHTIYLEGSSLAIPVLPPHV